MGPAPILLRRPLDAGLRIGSFGDRTDAHERVLWLEGHARAAVLHLKPHVVVDTHRHRQAAHHVWIVEGSCTLGGHAAGAGSYLYVPAGIEHGARAGSEGCILFYLIVPARRR